jgi:hypothetical protein
MVAILDFRLTWKTHFEKDPPMHIPAKFAVKWFIDLKYFCPLNPAQVIKHKKTAIGSVFGNKASRDKTFVSYKHDKILVSHG